MGMVLHMKPPRERPERKPEAPAQQPPKPKAQPAPPRSRGYYAVFREGEANWCPGCGRAHWFVGRTLAECAFDGCRTAVPIIRMGGQGCSTY